MNENEKIENAVETADDNNESLGRGLKSTQVIYDEAEIKESDLEEEVEEVDEEPGEEADEEDGNLSSSEYKLIVDLVKETYAQYNSLRDFTKSRLKAQYGIKEDILTDIISLTEDNIREISLEDGKVYLAKYLEDPSKIDELIKENQITDEEHDNLTEVGALRHILLDVKEDSMNIYAARQEIKKLKSESTDILNEYFTYLSSNEVQNQRLKRLERMKEAASKESDEGQKKKIMKMISAMEASYDLSFLFTRFEKLGEKEIESIMDCYFDKKKGSYIIDRYKNKIKNFGFEEKLYHYFLNLEENFLEEEYHVFNNLFLFIYMRLVAYSDPNDKTEKMYVQSLTSNMANLIYHRFASTENEKNFLEIIKKVLNHFKDLREYFDKNNTTHPGHPVRIEARKNHERKRREMLIEKMNQLNITGYDEDASANDLQEYMNSAIEEMVKAQTKETNTEEVEVSESDDDGLMIAPVMRKKESE